MINMHIKVSILFAVGVLLQFTNGNKQKKLDNLIKDIKTESDQVASEIYSWINQHKNDVKNYIKSHPRHYAKQSKAYVDGLVKTLKGESDHLANEIFSWLSKHKPRGQSRGISRGHRRHHHHKWKNVSRVFKHLGSRALSRARGNHVTKSRAHSRVRRATEYVNDGLEGKSIQDVMLDLMNSSQLEKKEIIQKTKKTVAKIRKSKVKKTATKAKKPSVKTKKSKVNIKVKSPKQTKANKNKTPEIKATKKSIITHAPTVKLHKTPSLPDLLKVISADPARKIVVTNKEDNVKIDQKSLKILNEIPKSVLKNLLKNIHLDKYFHMANFLSKGKESKDGSGSKNKQSKMGKNGSGHVSKKTARKTVKKSFGSARTPSKSKKKTKIAPAKIIKKVSTSTKKVTKLVPKKSSKTSKVSKKNGIVKTTKAKPKITTKTTSANKDLKDADHTHAHEKLSILKEKIKKTNSLKFKVAKALLEHCETQNKLRKIFENVNSSLKEAALVAKAIGKRFGIKTSDIDRLSTAHTEEAVTEFLDKFF